MQSFRCAVCALVLIALQDQCSASIANGPDVVIGGSTYRTFVDETTGLRWLDLDNFWDETSTYDSIAALLAGSSFRLARTPELEELQASIPAIPANFSAETLIVGGNSIDGNPHPGEDRDLMGGIFDDGDSSDGVAYSFKTGVSDSWSFATNALSPSVPLRSSQPTYQDLGAWIVSNAKKKEAKEKKEEKEEKPGAKGGKKNPGAPEPVSLAIWLLLGLNFGTAGCRRRVR
jgi:hypothetical protein